MGEAAAGAALAVVAVEASGVAGAAGALLKAEVAEVLETGVVGLDQTGAAEGSACEVVLEDVVVLNHAAACSLVACSPVELLVIPTSKSITK